MRFHLRQLRSTHPLEAKAASQAVSDQNSELPLSENSVCGRVSKSFLSAFEAYLDSSNGISCSRWPSSSSGFSNDGSISVSIRTF